MSDEQEKPVKDEQPAPACGNLYGITEAPKDHPENEGGNLKVIMG